MTVREWAAKALHASLGSSCRTEEDIKRTVNHCGGHPVELWPNALTGWWMAGLTIEPYSAGDCPFCLRGWGKTMAEALGELRTKWTDFNAGEREEDE